MLKPKNRVKISKHLVKWNILRVKDLFDESKYKKCPNIVRSHIMAARRNVSIRWLDAIREAGYINENGWLDSSRQIDSNGRKSLFDIIAQPGTPVFKLIYQHLIHIKHTLPKRAISQWNDILGTDDVGIKWAQICAQYSLLMPIKLRNFHMLFVNRGLITGLNSTRNSYHHQFAVSVVWSTKHTTTYIGNVQL